MCHYTSESVLHVYTEVAVIQSVPYQRFHCIQMCVKNCTEPVVLQIGAFLCHLAVDRVDDTDTDRVQECGDQP